MRSLTQKVFYSIIFTSLITLLVSVALIMGIYYYNFNTLLLDELENKAAYAVQGASISGYDYFDHISTNDHITWLNQDGVVLFDSHDQFSTISVSDCPEIIDAISNGYGSAVRSDKLLSPKVMYYAIALEDGTVIRLSSEQPTVEMMLSLVLGSLLILTAAVVILSAVFAKRMSTRIIKPINELNITSPNESTGYHELAPLVKRIRTQNSFIARQMDELRSKHVEFTAITENMSEGFLLIDENRNIISFNSSARKILDLAHESNVINQEGILGQAIDSALSGNRDEREASFGGADYRIITSPVLKEHKINGAVAIILDITEKSRREAMRREFTSNVSHELKTPLTSINAAAEMLSGGIVAPQDLNHFYGMIQNESARLIVLINDILRLSQLDENAIVDENRPVELRIVAENVIASLEAAAKSRDIEFVLQGNAVVSGVPTILEEMIFNLCDNAVKYNKTGGRVSILIAESDGTVTISVEDTGIGIPPDVHDRIFERFYRVDKSRSKEIGGTGLGLSIVRHAANYHNADITVESHVGEGTKITITFTCKNNQ